MARPRTARACLRNVTNPVLRALYAELAHKVNLFGLATAGHARGEVDNVGLKGAEHRYDAAIGALRNVAQRLDLLDEPVWDLAFEHELHILGELLDPFRGFIK